MTPFRTNRELFAFVEELMEYLQSKQELDLVDRLTHANRFVTMVSSEYLNEVDLALKEVLSAKLKHLSAEREEEIRQTSRQIDQAFRTHGQL